MPPHDKLFFMPIFISEPVQTTTEALPATADCAGPETQKSSSASRRLYKELTRNAKKSRGSTN